jgi:hypothetical protein
MNKQGPMERFSFLNVKPKSEKISIFLALVFLTVINLCPAFAELPPASKLIPAGFQVISENNLGGSMIVQAIKPNVNFPQSFVDQGIHLNCTWMQNPAAQQVLSMLVQAPEEPMQDLQGQRDEPCGKRDFKGGVLSCRKITIPWIGLGQGPDLITYNISWLGADSTGLVGVTVDHFYGDQNTAINWIDAIIPKLLSEK